MEQQSRDTSSTDSQLPPELADTENEQLTAPEPVSVKERQAEVADLQASLQQEANKGKGKTFLDRFKKQQDTDLHRNLQIANDKYVRLLAEMDNLKKRTEREKEEGRKFFAESLMRDLLCVLDSFTKGFAANDITTNPEPFIAGMKMVEEQLREILSKHGLEVISSAGKEFDPHIHQAIQKVESKTVKTASVKEEFAHGYLLRGRLLRAAMVSVYVPSADESNEKKQK